MGRGPYKKKTETATLFIFHDPDLTRCCVCGCSQEQIPMRIETRPTGPGFKVQLWPYCPRCWAGQSELCGITTEAMLDALANAKACVGKNASVVSDEDLDRMLRGILGGKIYCRPGPKPRRVDEDQEEAEP
jgi:hypothetical protein